MIRLFTVLLLMMIAVAAFAQDRCIYFSEYVEGAGSDAAFEIYNATGEDIDLSLVVIDLLIDSSPSEVLTLTLSGVLQNGDVYVVAHPDADAAILMITDMTSEVCSFDGNDVLRLSHDGTIVDMLGVPEDDSVWGADTVLRRLVTICCGNVVFDSAGEWAVYPIGSWDSLGEHTTNCEVVAGDHRSWSGVKSDFW